MILIDDPKSTCKLGQGSKCCAFLVCGAHGFECIKSTAMSKIIHDRLEKGTMHAKGEGDWDGCILTAQKEAP